MIYTVPAVMPESRFGLTGIESMIQTVQIIATMYSGQAPMDREMGIDSSVNDIPESRRLLLRGRIIDAVETFEPRVEVLEVVYMEQEGAEESGSVYPYVKFRERGVV